MKKAHLFGCIFACVAAIASTSSYASIIIYEFTGTVTDAGNIAGVSASLGDTIVGEFAYDTSTLDSNPGDTTSGHYRHPDITPPLKITLPGGSITFDDFTTVFVTASTDINIAAGVPDPTVSGNNIDHDIIFPLKSTSTALATDALPTSIDLDDFESVTGAFSSFSLANGPAGDPIFYSIDALVLRTESVTPSSYLAAGSPGDTWTYKRSDTSKFTWTLSAITTGPNAGRMMLGNGSTWTIYDVLIGIFTIYETETGMITPPLAFPAFAQTDQMITIDGQAFLFMKAPGITVKPGSSSDVLGLVWLDSAYGPNVINTQLGLSSAITAAVTDVDWFVGGVGLVKHIGVDASTGTIDDDFELVGTSIDPFPTAIFGSGEGKEVIKLEDCGSDKNYATYDIQLKPDGKWKMESPLGAYSGKYEVAIPGEKLTLSLNKKSKSRLYEYIGQASKSLCKVKGKILSPKIKKFIVKLDDDELKVVLIVKYKATDDTNNTKGTYKVILNAEF